MSNSEALVHVYYLLPYSRTTGPGNRAVIWLQTCSLGAAECRDICGKDTRTCQTLSVAYILSWLKTLGDSIDGVTIAGSEPFDQRDAVCTLVRSIKAETSLSVVLFTALTLYDIEASGCSDVLTYVDVLVAGQTEVCDRNALPREVFPNKAIYLCTPCYTSDDMQALPQAEVVITPEGDIILMGPDTLQW